MIVRLRVPAALLLIVATAMAGVPAGPGPATSAGAAHGLATYGSLPCALGSDTCGIEPTHAAGAR